jgi:ABC-type sugar transport system ATPase subunit
MTQRDPSAVLRLARIEKSFGGVRALRGANLEAQRGEIMGLCGENGAGKSTLLKVLSGVHPFGSYTGDVVLQDQVRRFAGPSDARKAGIAVVYQELTLVPELTMAQNLLLGREPRRFGFVDNAKLEAMARAQLAEFGLADAIDVTQPVSKLGIGVQQMVEIMRALPQGASVLILDEPTAALTPHEAELLMGWLRGLRDRGTTCLYVSHRLDEIFALCDRITVLRDGRTAATLTTRETTPQEVVREMIGRTMEHASAAPSSKRNGHAPALRVEDYHVHRAVGPQGKPESSRRPYVLSGVSFSLYSGEILAVCGAMGSGRTALLSSLFGCARAGTSGHVFVNGVEAQLDSPRAAIERGMAYVPEDRKGAGLVLGMTVAENLALPVLDSAQVMGKAASVGLVDRNAETQLAARRIEALHIRGDAETLVGNLSGGNQQKVVLGKWLENPPKVLVLDEPTRGVDIGAREEIHLILEQLAEKGVAILIASSDLQEVVRLAHRAIVLVHGRVAAELQGDAITQQAIVELSTASTPSSSHLPVAKVGTRE